MDGTHALSLKVMRLSRPNLATSWHPFFLADTGPLADHAAASVMSLQGPELLQSSPSTLRDFSLSQILTLPATFGSINLGETFSGSVCVNNDSYHPPLDAVSVALRVEMQTATSKAVIGEFGGQGTLLKPAACLETVVHHEIKELGQHVLACTVSYRIPPILVPTYPVPPDDPSDPTFRSFRKYYKFMVTNPLSVKTKVQTAKSPNALLNPYERSKVFLEVHVQNLTQQPMTFQRLKFECVDGWRVLEAHSSVSSGQENSGIDAMTTMPPQDVRQYLYVLIPVSEEHEPFLVAPSPGSVIPLGRLDISWTTSFGEPGRLLTSMLSRRIPLLSASPPPPPLSGVPPHLQRNSVPPHAQSPSAVRPQSPHITGPPSRPSSPSPFRVRNVGVRPQSPSISSVTSVPGQQPPLPPLPQQASDVRASLFIRHIPEHGFIKIQIPFKVGYKITLSSLTGNSPETVTLQHLERPRTLSSVASRSGNHPNAVEDQHGIGILSSPGTAPTSSFGVPPRGSPNWGDLLSATRSNTASPDLVTASPTTNTRGTSEESKRGFGMGGTSTSNPIPAPFLDRETLKRGGVMYLGSSIITLHKQEEEGGVTAWLFELEFIALWEGFQSLDGGLRLLQGSRTIHEWDALGEVWV